GDRPGGCARTGEIAPGFRGPTLAHAGAIDPAIARALALDRHGLRLLRGAVDVCAPVVSGRALVLPREAGPAAEAIAAHSRADGQRYPQFLESFARVSRVLRALCESAPPSIDSPTPGDLIELLKTG